ncbi:MAG: MerR family transcriptional regulator [Candidatus Accumulibacter sp.]|nr:MerR family transcriptional regulator [Accumulibacter sp.]
MREDDFKNGLGDDREYDAGGDTADVLIGSLLEESWLTVEQVAAACAVEPDWLLRHLEEGLLPGAESVAGIWRFSAGSLQRARRMRQLERDFDAIPELAALVADLLEEMDDMRSRLRRHGPP